MIQKQCDKCRIKKDYTRLGFLVAGQLERCLSCQINESYSNDIAKGCVGNVIIE